MKNKVSWLMMAMVLLASLMLSGEAMVQAAPQIPATFSGEITENGSYIPAGGTLRVLANNAEVAQTTVQVAGGVSGYFVEVPIDDPDTPAVEGATAGAALTFEVDGTEANETDTANAGSSNTLNLTLTPIDPPDPATFSGSVLQDGNNVADGTVVHIVANGIEYAQTTTQVTGGISNYSVSVPIDDPNTAIVEGVADGTTVQFEINGQPASESGTAVSGTTSTLNLTFSSPDEDCLLGNACLTVSRAGGDLYYEMQDIVFPPTDMNGNTIVLVSDDRDWLVVDERSDPNGWTLTIQAMQNFSNGSGGEIPLSGFWVDVWPEDISPRTGAGASPTGQSGTIDSQGTVMLFANDGQGTGQFDFTPTFRLGVPSDTPDGNYHTTVFVTLTEGGP